MGKYLKIFAGSSKERPATKPLVHLAVFDFDGTSIYGNSPVTLVKHLFLNRMMGPISCLQVGFWGIAYHFHLPQNEAWVRGKVFKSFQGMPREDVDKFLRDFYDERIEKMWLPKAQAAIDRHVAAGDEVLWISATFEPIVERAAELHRMPHFMATQMEPLDDGTYGTKVVGKPMEGHEKLKAVQRWADERFGPGNWELTYAYADHYSDTPLLTAAVHPCCVNPGPTLRKHAEKVGWPIEEWDERKQQKK